MLRSNNTKWQYRGQWSGLAVGKVAESTDDSSVSALLVSRNSSGDCSLGKDSSQMFTPPEGPKFLPLSECPNLASTLTDRERRRIESLAETLLAQVHDGGFRVSLKPGTMKKSRKVYGDIHETYANWYIVVHRDFKPNRQDESVHDLGLDDNQTLAAALYLCEKLGASVKNVHLFKPFRPSAYVEAWLAQSEVSDVSLLRARHGAAAIALSEYRTNAIVGSEPNECDSRFGADLLVCGRC